MTRTTVRTLMDKLKNCDPDLEVLIQQIDADGEEQYDRYAGDVLVESKVAIILVDRQVS